MFYQLVVVIILSVVKAAVTLEYYNVPVPKITVNGNGFEVEIDHEDGIELLYFHGKVLTSNVKVAPESVIDLQTYEREGDKWVLKSNYSDFSLDDSITYWLYIKKNGIGYRLPPTEYVIKKINRKSSQITAENTTTPLAPNLEDLRADMLDCGALCAGELQNLTHKLATLRGRINLLRKSLAQITEVMDMQNGAANFSYLNHFTVY
uniref:CBM39 domain-containing protein n=1 Tax=Photinus pyralis TaxID=7054 RepID=A0A1Y1M120_PHOPY